MTKETVPLVFIPLSAGKQIASKTICQGVSLIVAGILFAYILNLVYHMSILLLGLLNPLSGLLLEADVSQSALNITFSDSEIIGSVKYLLNYTGIYMY